jgi:serine phosphatase RsbU (regulator of sigma subunit)
MGADLSDRINEALAREEARAERFANNVRLVLLSVLGVIGILNIPSVSAEANELNFGALLICLAYGAAVHIRIRRSGYHPAMKYITSCLDVLLVFLLLFFYTTIDIAAVALKNYAFLIVFPLTVLTALRFDRTLTFAAGGLAVALYVSLILALTISGAVTISSGGYERELFTPGITYIGQLTKVLILAGFVLLLSYLAGYSRALIVKLVTEELNMRREKELNDWELGLASEVQTRFLPQSFPAVPGLDIHGEVRQGRYVGGDYFDFIRLQDGRLLMVVADVSGKGVPAALIMAEVRASTHVLSAMGFPLEDFAARLNAVLHQSTDRKSFVTCFAAVIDAPNRRLTYINAGHPPPALCSNGAVRPLGKGTMPLGSLAALPNLAPRDEVFGPGAVLVAYTDGLLEQTDPGGEQFGEENILNSVMTNSGRDSRSLTRRLLDDLGEFAAGNGPNDDICVAVVRNIGNPATEAGRLKGGGHG